MDIGVAAFRPPHMVTCKVQCSNCNLREICIPVGLTREELSYVENRLVAVRRKVGRGEMLFHTGDAHDYGELATLEREVPQLQRQFHTLMGREIASDHEVMFLLGSIHAEERVAAFLLNLTHRLHARGFSASSILLRMSRGEIGNFLGLKLETVSRTSSRFQADRLLDVRQRQIEILDPAGLQRLLDGMPASR